MKSFKHDHLFYLYLYMPSEHTFSFQMQTDLDLRSRTFSLKINNFPTFSEINPGWYVQILCLCSQMSSSHTEFQLHIVF